MFNNCFDLNDGELILFNSYVGIGSLCRVTSECAQKIRDILRKKEITTNCFAYESAFNTLCRCGYLVHSEEDELLKAEMKHMKLISNQDGGNLLHLIILPTEQCNFRCTYCYEDFNKPKMSVKTQEALINFVRKQLYFYAGLSVSWFGGEPLTAIDVMQSLSDRFIALCMSARKSYVSSVTTNGYLLSEQNFRALLSRRVLSYQVTIDGPKQVHDKYRHAAGGEGTFDAIIGNLKSIRDNIKSNTFHVSIRTNFTQESATLFEEYCELLNETFGGDKRFSLFIRSVGNQGGNNGIDNMLDSLLGSDGLNVVFDKATDLSCRMPINVDQHMDMISPGGSMCYAGFSNYLVIDPYGGIRKCTHYLNEDFNLIGRLEPNGQANIDEGKEARWIGRMILNDQCKSCGFLGSCFNHVCPAGRLDNPNNDGAACPVEKDHLREILMIAATSSSYGKLFNQITFA